MTLKPLRLLPLVLLPFGPALAQQGPDLGLIRAFMEGCLQASAGDAPAMDTCKCMAKLILPGPGTAGEADAMAAMMQCSPGMGALLQGG